MQSTRLVVRAKWVEAQNQWHLELPDGTFIYNFFGCAFFKRLFKNADKEKPKLYIIYAEEFSNG